MINQTRKYIYAAFFGLIVLVFVAFIAIRYFGNTSTKVSTAQGTTTVNNVLRRDDPDFTAGLTALGTKDFAAALADFQKALPRATDPAQQGLVQYYIGLSEELLAHYSEAIATYKVVGANQTYKPIIRAYAIQEIGLMYHTYYNALPEIASSTFTGTPYASFKVANNSDASYTNLFKYAVSIYPLALSESFVAYGYDRHLGLVLHGATTTQAGAKDVQNITTAITAANLDLSRMVANPNEVTFVAATLSRLADVEHSLLLYGVPGYSLADIDSLFQRALQYAATNGGVRGNFIAWHYAVDLVKLTGSARAAEIHALLAPFSANNSAEIDPHVVVFLKQLPTNAAMTLERRDTVQLGEIDPDFKSYLLTIGWHASDFTQS